MFRVFKINDFNGNVHRFVYNCDRRETRRIRRSISAQIKSKTQEGRIVIVDLEATFEEKRNDVQNFPCVCVCVCIYTKVLLFPIKVYLFVFYS